MLKDQFGFKSDDRKIIGYDSNIDYAGYEYISTIFNAIANKRVVKLVYQPFDKPSFEFDFHPYYLKQYNNRSFVFGRNDIMKIDQWNVPLDRITSIMETNSSYIKDTTDWDDYFYDMVGVTKPVGKAVEEVKLLVGQAQAPYVITKPLHPSQRITTLNDGSIEVRIHVIPNYELEKLLLSYGETIKVLEPLSLQISLGSRIEKMNNI